MRVSVCVPTVNRIAYLREALASVAAQTYSDFEVLIADNSGNCTYGERVKATVAEFPGLSCRLFHHPEKVSMAENVNFLIDRALGEYWICLPDDDRMRPECLSVLAEALDSNPEAGFAFSDHWIIRSDGMIDRSATDTCTKRYRRSELRGGFIMQEDLLSLALNQSFQLQSMLLRRDVIRMLKFSPNTKIPDFDMQIRITQSIPPIHAYYCAERLTEYRVHGGQFTRQTDVKEFYRHAIASLEGCYSVPLKFRKQFRQKLAAYHLSLALIEARDGNKSDSTHHLRKSIALDPISLKPYLCSALFQLPGSAVAHLQSLVRTLKGLNS